MVQNEQDRIVIRLSNSLSKRYRARRAGSGDKTVQSVIPFEVVEREARRVGFAGTKEGIDLFLEAYEIEFHYNHFGGVHFEFVPRKKV